MPDHNTLARLAPPVEPLDAATRGRLQAGLHRRRRPRRRGLLAAPVALALVLPAIVILVSSRGQDRAWGADALRVARAAPRLLVGDDWRVVRADEWSARRGEMTFARGRDRLDLSWVPAAEHPGVLRSLQDKSTAAGSASAAGIAAPVFHDAGIDDAWATTFVDGSSSVLARANTADRAAFVALLAHLRHVGVDAWLEAMPADVVRPAAAHAAAVDEMLRGLPLPPGFDATALRQGTTVRDRYQLGAQVAGAVACGWIADWITARATGDAVRAETAVRAMATATTWPVLVAMQPGGAYGQEVAMYATAIRDGGRMPKGDVASSYVDALGCPDATP
jgi:hypothetical protein